MTFSPVRIPPYLSAVDESVRPITKTYFAFTFFLLSVKFILIFEGFRFATS